MLAAGSADGGRGHASRNAGVSGTLEEARNDPPQSLQKEHGPEDPSWTSPLQSCERINKLEFLQATTFVVFVTAAIRN